MRARRLLLLTHLLDLFVGDLWNVKVRRDRDVVGGNDVIQKFLFLLRFQFVANEILNRSITGSRILRVLDTGRDQDVTGVIGFASSTCRGRRGTRGWFGVLVSTRPEFTLQLDDVKSKIGLDQIRTDLSRLESKCRSLKRCDHAALGDIFVNAALHRTIGRFIARIFGEFVSESGEIFASLSTVENSLSLGAFLRGVEFRMLGDVLRDFFVGHLCLLGSLFRV